MRSRWAFTIMETIIALFLIVGAALFAAQMFQIALHASSLSRDESLALLVAEKKILELRHWSRTHFNEAWPDGVGEDQYRDGPIASPSPSVSPDTRSSIFGTSVSDDNPIGGLSDSEHPRFTVSVQTWKTALYSPARNLTGAVRMTESARLARVTVRWGSDDQIPRSRRLSLLALVTEPPRSIGTISVTPTVNAGPVKKGDYRLLTAKAMDGGGQEIKDLIFRFYVSPKTGNASLLENSAYPTKAILQNYVTYPYVSDPVAENRIFSTGGNCDVRVRAISDGREVWNSPATEMTLEPAAATPEAATPSPVPSPWPSP